MLSHDSKVQGKSKTSRLDREEVVLPSERIDPCLYVCAYICMHTMLTSTHTCMHPHTTHKHMHAHKCTHTQGLLTHTHTLLNYICCVVARLHLHLQQSLAFFHHCCTCEVSAHHTCKPAHEPGTPWGLDRLVSLLPF